MPRPPPPNHAAATGRAPRAGDVLLAWARDRAGKKVHASRLAGADRRTRAPFTCLGCGEELIPHLGRIRTPHFAHRAGSTCPLTAPESALHLDAKERLLALCADAFAGRRRLVALARCPACRRVQPVDVAALGDRAVDEGAVGALRADVLDAREEWEREGAAGERELVCHRTLGLGPCAACQVRARAETERDRGGEAAEIAELEGYRARGLFRGARAEGGQGGRDDPLTPAERARVAAAFRCPECGGTGLQAGERLVRHPCGSA